MKIKPWSEDKWFSTSGTIIKYDKVEHLILGFIGLFVTLLLIPEIGGCIFIWEVIALAWEAKDGFFPYGPDGKIEGFSIKDFIADNAGFIIAIALYFIITVLKW